MYKRYRYPTEIIQYTVWLYYRFNLSHRDIEDLLAKSDINVTYEAIRLWCNRFGPKYAARLKRKHQGYGDTFFIDEVFVRIGGIYITSGGRLIKKACPMSEASALGMVRLLMCISKNDVTVQQRSDSLKD